MVRNWRPSATRCNQAPNHAAMLECTLVERRLIEHTLMTRRLMKSMSRSTLLIVAASVLAACETPPPSAPAPKPVVAPAVVEAPPPPPPAPPPPGPVTPEGRQQAQKIALAAADLLENGNEDQARNELKRALTLDPQNKLALSLVRQMTVDPMATLGRESFAYTVRPGDSMSRIASRFLNDVYSFYLLARYNDIKVPRQVSAGQVIRVPGRAPPAGSAAANPPPAPPAPPAPPSPSPQPEPARAAAPAPAAPVQAAPPPPPPDPGEVAMRNAAAAEKSGDLVRARNEYVKASGFGQTAGAAKAEQIRAQLVTRYSVNARSALSRQDLDGAIVQWQRVLDLEPDNATARLELDRVRGLKEKLKNVK